MTTTERGYGWSHQQQRSKWVSRVNTGRILCWRCRNPINPDEPWDLGHTHDRTAYMGPEHPACNRAPAGSSWRRPPEPHPGLT